MRILGIDPGSIRTGFAVLAIEKNKFSLISGGTIVLSDEEPLSARLVQLDEDLGSLIKKFSPTEIALETIFFAKNAQSALKLGHARGVILRKAAAEKLTIAEYSPTEVKSAIGGSGRAKKDQLARLLRFYLKLPKNYEFKTADHSDALAIAFTHAQSKCNLVDLKGLKKDLKFKNDRASFWQTT